MKQWLEQTIDAWIDTYCEQQKIQRLWRNVRVGFADANSPLFLKLRTVANANHKMPHELLTDAKTVISYFLPFTKEVEESNHHGDDPSRLWEQAKLETNAMAIALNTAIIAWLKDKGALTVDPGEAAAYDKERCTSRWSQRHVAYIAGQGTFGINNMLISPDGCCGRYFSLVSTIDVLHDVPETNERCLYKAKGSCKKCVEKCPAQALHVDKAFDRFACQNKLLDNVARLDMASDVCGKCDTGLPCAMTGEFKSA